MSSKQLGKIEEEIKLFWQDGEGSVLLALEAELESQRIAGGKDRFQAAKDEHNELARAIVAAEDLIITGPLTEVAAQQGRVELLTQRYEQAGNRVRQLEAEGYNPRAERRYVIGAWPEAKKGLEEPWTLPPQAAVLLCQLREEIKGLDVPSVAEAAYVRLQGAELVVTAQHFPELVVKGRPIEEWRNTNALIQYREGEMAAHFLTRLLLRGPHLRPHTVLPERRVAVLACRADVSRGDPTFVIIHDFRPPHEQESERVYA